MSVDYHEALTQMGMSARAACRKLAVVRGAKKNRALEAMADHILQQEQAILEANQKDMENGRQAQLSAALLDRLELTPERIRKIAKSIQALVGLEDPVGRVDDTWLRPNGLQIKKARVPIGVVGIIYESRPNVTADAAALCLKAGNAVFLRGGSEAFITSQAIVNAMHAGLEDVGLPKELIQFVPWTEREAVDALLKLNDYIDVIIPRGGEGLIRKVVETSTIPVIKHYKGVCHVYVDKEIDEQMALNIAENAKCQRPGVCNAMETLLIHQEVAQTFAPKIAEKLLKRGVELRGDEQFCQLCPDAKPASEEDWNEEYLDLILSVRIVDSVEQAVEHINHYGTQHSDAIVTTNSNTASYFTDYVDSAAVYVNASTRFTDGSEFGMGAEIGISTDRIHARGPMGIDELTTYRYVVQGKGQIRT